MATSYLQLHSVQEIDKYHCEQEITFNTEKSIPKEYNFRKIDTVKIDKESLQSEEWLQHNNPSVSSYEYSKHNYYTKNHQILKCYRKKLYTKKTHFIPKPNLQECTTSKNQNYKKDLNDLLGNIKVDNEGHQIMTVTTQSKKTPVTILNDWSMRGNGTDNKRIAVSYELTSIEGNTHKPKFIYMCRVLKNIATGEGHSKREAKQNSANEMLKTLFKTNSTPNNDKVITSTTTTNNLVVNTNEIANSTMSLQKIDKNEKEQSSNIKAVQIESCIMNPIGALQELCTAYKWIPPTYNTQKMHPCSSDYKIAYRVICHVFFLQTEGHGSTKQEAKRNSASLMNKKIHEFGVDKLNEIKCSKNRNIIPIMIYEDSSIKNEENKNPIWNTAQMFRVYFKIAANTTKTDAHDEISTLTNYSNNSDNVTPREHELELEKLIIEFNSDSNAAVKQLELLGQKLGFIISYVTIDQIKSDTNQDKKYTILLQVTTKPVIVTTIIGSSIDEALEEAAKSILITMKSMMLFTTSIHS